MTLTRTIHRRNARKRAKAAAAAWQRRWDAMTPEQREYVEAHNRMMCRLILPVLENNLVFARQMTRPVRTKPNAPDAIDVRLPMRYRR